MLPTPTASNNQPIADTKTMQPPQFPPARAHNAQSKPVIHQPILMKNNGDSMTSSMSQHDDDMDSDSGEPAFPEEKRLQKRAANRRSAQLSRKRKKQFIEELKEENDDLRRKEQILRSIPDLIVVFNSSGKLGFVSHSVSNFLEFTPTELIGSSFWERLCDESVRLLKAAFMDALAARSNAHDTTPLGSGVWELRLQDKKGGFVLVTLNGVVHFSGDAPECVCSIRPMKTENPSNTGNGNTTTSAEATAKPVVHKRKASDLLFGSIKPEQSVGKTNAIPSQRFVRQKVAAAISDVDSGSSEVSSY